MKITLVPFFAGFLKTQSRQNPHGKGDSTDNLGIQDITAALRWIKLNIASFGGDPHRVTLIGHDTGAALVNLLFVSPTSKGNSHFISYFSCFAFFYRRNIEWNINDILHFVLHVSINESTK